MNLRLYSNKKMKYLLLLMHTTYLLTHTTYYHQPLPPQSPTPYNPMYDNAPMPPLGTNMSETGDEETEYWERRHEEMMGNGTVSRGQKWICHGKKKVQSCKGDKEAYIFQVGPYYIAIDTIMGILLNVGSDALTWHYSTVSIDGDINTHVRAMMDHCGQMLRPQLYNITCTTLNK